MMGDYHVRFCEGLGGQFPWSTRHNAFALFCERESQFLSQEREKGEFSSHRRIGCSRSGTDRFIASLPLGRQVDPLSVTIHCRIQ